ncbi:MAG: hypothetical protein AB7I18_08030 [Candidatus Berkiella sp.]
MFESGSKEDTALKWLCAAAGGYMVSYASGPLTGYLAQFLYTKGFYLLYGAPDPWLWWLSPNQWRGYINAGHVFHYAYDYGNAALGLAAAPFFYTLPDLIRYCVTRKKPINAEDQAVLERELKHLHELGYLLRKAPEAAVDVVERVTEPVLGLARLAANEDSELKSEQTPAPKPVKILDTLRK